MALFQFFKGTIHSIEQFDRETVPGYDSYETPMDYGFVQNENFHPEGTKNRFLTIQIGDDTVEYCVCDSDLLKLSEGGEVTLVFSGKKIVSVLNSSSGYYCFYKSPLYRKFTLPKIMNGISMAITAIIVGYIVHLIALQVRSSLFQIITEGTAALCFVGGLIYAAYYQSSQKMLRDKISKYIRQLEGLQNNGA